MLVSGGTHSFQQSHPIIPINSQECPILFFVAVQVAFPLASTYAEFTALVASVQAVSKPKVWSIIGTSSGEEWGAPVKSLQLFGISIIYYHIIPYATGILSQASESELQEPFHYKWTRSQRQEALSMVLGTPTTAHSWSISWPHVKARWWIFKELCSLGRWVR